MVLLIKYQNNKRLSHLFLLFFHLCFSTLGLLALHLSCSKEKFYFLCFGVCFSVTFAFLARVHPESILPLLKWLFWEYPKNPLILPILHQRGCTQLQKILASGTPCHGCLFFDSRVEGLFYTPCSCFWQPSIICDYFVG